MSARDEKSLWEALFTLIGAVAFVPLMIGAMVSLGGWVISVLWGWFVVPAFGLPAISIPTAIGIDSIVTYMTWHGYKEDDSSTGKKFLMVLVRPGIMLLIGWVVHRFFM